MPILDHLLSATIKYLKKKQKGLRRKRKSKRKNTARPKKAASKSKRITKRPKKVSEVQPKPVCVGKVTHFFSRIQVVVVKLKGPLRVGNQVHIKGKTTNFKQKIRSIQIESVDVPAARKGQLVGLKVDKKAKEGDEVFLLS